MIELARSVIGRDFAPSRHASARLIGTRSASISAKTNMPPTMVAA